MKHSSLTKRSLTAGLLVIALTGCTVSATPPGGGNPGVTPPPPPPPSPTVRASDIALSPGVFYGANGIRARVQRSGRGYTVQNLTGKNGSQDFYADQGNNFYKGPGNFNIKVQSRTRFVWRGVHGTKIMHDKRRDAR